MVEVRRREKESVGALARRFTRKIMYSKVLMTARGLQFRERPLSKMKKRKNALHREEQKQHYEHMRKLGKIK